MWHDYYFSEIDLAVFLFQLKQLETELGKIEKAIASFKLAE